MTEDILFDNIYIGHSVEEAKALADETYFVKKALEEEAKKVAEAADEDEPETTVTFQEDPVTFIRQKIFNFIETAKVDPIFAFKTQPETGAAIALLLTTFFGMLGVLFGLIGGAQKPITKVRFIPTCACSNDLMVNVKSSLLRRRTRPQLTTRLPRLRPRQSPPLPQAARRLRPLSRSGSSGYGSKIGIIQIPWTS